MTPDRMSRGKVQRVLAGAAGEGQRLDNFLLRTLSGVPRSRVYRLLRRGEVRVNGKRKQADYRLSADDEVRLPPVLEVPAGAALPRRPADSLLASVRAAIVHEDARMLVLNKPAGLAVHGGSGLAFGAIEALRALRPAEPLELAHRLDRDTSGCLLVARDRPALRMLHALLREGQIEKRYAALVAGRWRLGRKTIDAPVLTNTRQAGERVVRVHAAGKTAISRFTPRQAFRSLATLMDVAIDTGRTHQIRVHAAFAGHPIVGDDKYGDREFNRRMHALGLRRMFLHAAAVAFKWPDSKQLFEISVELPDDLAGLLLKLPDAASATVQA
ncbi:MAG TPA: RluA family pseudouridine synthase [Steroidobacteraceae bacterium]|nr:RluA family pseudouridine synthase [Steroidobacteraceae bacterium]